MLEAEAAEVALPAGTLGEATLRALGEKYSALVRLREERAAGGEAAPREVLKPLAERFPGVLRELETVPLGALRERLAAVESALRGEGPARQWMRWVEAYHRWMRAALAARRVRGEGAGERVRRELGFAAPEGWLEAMRAPERGRMRPFVLACAAQEVGAEVDALRAWLLPKGSRGEGALA